MTNCISDQTAAIATERCPRVNECGNPTQDDQREPSTYQPGPRYSVSDVPSQMTTEDDHYMEILETSYYQNVDVSAEQHLEFISDEVDDDGVDDDDDDDDDSYDQPESPYDHLDSSAVIITPPAPSIYDRLTH